MKLVKVIGQRVRSNQPFIHIHHAGVIRFSEFLCRQINLLDGNNVAFFNDLDNPGDWYFKINEPGDKVRCSPNSSQSMIINNAYVAKKILGTISKEKARILVSLETIRDGYYPIITASAV